MPRYTGKITFSFEQDSVDDPVARQKFMDFYNKTFVKPLEELNMKLQNLVLTQHGSSENILKRGSK